MCTEWLSEIAVEVACLSDTHRCMEPHITVHECVAACCIVLQSSHTEMAVKVE